ncbi:hypothetical protein [Gaoshiqia sp. Z1-71]|uniref:hypothetical protein n=1 Tax=Gaoshiqia hydrogeniformans TaxID=3290090 RepID=UPI003BF90F4B
MKKFKFYAMMAFVLTVFSACQNDELAVEQPQAVAAVENIPDVYLENGYLAFKNFNAVDSVLNSIAGKTREEMDAWDTEVGITSARSEFETLFDEYEQLSSMEEFQAFKSKYYDQLNFNDAEEDDCSIDYPFMPNPYTNLLNSDGMIKIGQSLFKFTKLSKIAVYDGDLEKMNNIDQYRADPMVEITMQTKDSRNYVYNDVWIYPGSNPPVEERWHQFGSRKMICELMVYQEKYLEFTVSTYYHYWQRTNVVFFQQRALKKDAFGWNSYQATFEFNNLYVKLGTQTTIFVPGATSPSRKTARVSDLVWEQDLKMVYSSDSSTKPDYMPISDILFSCYVGFSGRSGEPYYISYPRPMPSGFPGSVWLIEHNYD